MIKEKLITAKNWVADKVKRAWNWTKRNLKKLLIATGILGLALAAPPVIEDLLYPVEYVTAPENNTYKIGVLNYDAVLAPDITADQPLKYQLDDKFISFKPTEMRWDDSPLKSISATEAKIDEKKYLYEDAFGEGIDIDMNFGDRVFEKIVKIDSLKDLGEIPVGTEYLEIEFEIETNFVIDGWNKRGEFEIADTVRLGDYSYLEPAKAWDSYEETICEMVEECEDVCDDWCIDDSDGCDVCECEIQEVCETFNNRIRVKSILSNEGNKLYLTKYVPMDWLKAAQFPVYADADITYGTASTFNSAATSFIRATEYDTNKFVVCYTEIPAGQCRPATVSGTTITYKTEEEFNADIVVAGAGNLLDVCKLDTDKIVAVYSSDGDDDDGYARANTIDGSDEFDGFGVAKEFETGDTEYPACGGVATDKFVICYNDEAASDTAKCVGNTVSGTTITTGTATTHLSGTTDFYAITGDVIKLDTDKFIYCFDDRDSTPDANHCVVGTTIGGTTITLGTLVNLSSGAFMLYTDVSSPATDQFIAAWDAGNDTTDGEAVVGTVATRTITLGSVADFITSTARPQNVSIAAVDSTHVLVAYADQDNGTRGDTKYGTVDFGARSVSWGSAENYEAGSMGGGAGDFGNDIELIGSTKVTICFQDDDDSDYGKCIIGDAAAPAAARRIFITQ